MLEKLLRCAICWLLVLGVMGCQRPPAVTSPTSPPPPVQNTPTLPALPTQVTQLPTPTPEPLGAQRVIVVAIEGAGADYLSAVLPGGASGQLEQVDPPTGRVAHASLACGCWPSQSGIAGERVHRPEDAIYWYTPAYDLPIVSPVLTEFVSQAGLTSAALFWPEIEPGGGQVADYIVNMGEPDALSEQHKLALQPAAGWVNVPESTAPPREAMFTIQNRNTIIATVYVLATSLQDSEAGFDALILSNGDRTVDESDLRLAAMPDQWGYWLLDGEQGQGVDMLITEISPDSVTLFQSRVYHLLASPPDLHEAVVEQFAYPPPQPDYYALDQGWITERQFMDMLQRQSDWMMDVTLWLDQTHHPDLLLTVQSPTAQAGFEFGTGNVNYQEALTQAGNAIVRLHETVADEIEQRKTTLIVAGLAPVVSVRTQVNLNTVLEQAELLALDRRDFVVTGQTKAIAFTSGGAAHIYINLQGRERDGIVSPEAYEEIQSQIDGLLEGLTDPSSGEPVFARIVRGGELALLHLDDSYAPDIFVQALPGYFLSDERGREAIFEPPALGGAQGYPASESDMMGFLWVVGGGLATNVDLGTVHLLDLAPTIAYWLGIDVPVHMEGQLIPAIQMP